MFENIGNFFKKMMKTEQKELLVDTTSKDAAKERLHIVLMQDRANVSADFLELMKQEIIDVIKKYIVIDEEQIDVRLTNQENEDGTTGAPSLYANIPILNIRNDIKGEVLSQNSAVKTNIESNVDFSDRTVMIPAVDDKTIIENNVEEILNIQNENKPEESDIQETNTEDIENKESEIIENNDLNSEKDDENTKEINLDDLENITEEFPDETDEDDDDVTFDDLLKAAEEEEKKEAEEKAKIEAEKKTAPKKNTTKKTTGKGKKKTAKSTSKKKK